MILARTDRQIQEERNGSEAVYVSQPEAVADLIAQAAQGGEK